MERGRRQLWRENKGKEPGARVLLLSFSSLFLLSLSLSHTHTHNGLAREVAFYSIDDFSHYSYNQRYKVEAVSNCIPEML